MADEEDVDEEIEIFLNTLSKGDFENLASAPEILNNFETLNEIIEPLRETENEFQNPDLKISKTIRSKIQIITPKKELNEKNTNFIKDILTFQKGYEANAEKSNQTIDLVKNNFKDLSDSVSSLIKSIEELKKQYFDYAKKTMEPIRAKKEEIEKLDKTKLKDKKKFDEKNNKVEKKIKEYDQKLVHIIKDLKEVFNKIGLNIKGYINTLNNLDKPINSMIENIENIFNDFEEKSKSFINIIYNTPNESEQAMNIFKEIRTLNNKILELIDKQKNELNSQNQTLKTEKDKCSKDLKEIKKIENDSLKKIKDLQKETKNLINEINELLTFCSLPKINIKINEFKGLQLDKIQETVVEGTEKILKANTKIEVNISELKKYIEEEETIFIQTVNLDLAFIMDITGSMNTYLNFAKEKILTIIDKITKDSNVEVKLGFVGYRDYLDSKDEYLIYPELTNEVEKVRSFISSAKSGGGKDCEDMGGGLQKALDYKWESKTKFAILLADAPCHGEQYHEIKKFDSHPKGDPKYKIDQLVKKYAEKDINLLCLNITEMTVKLYNNFVDYYQKGRKNEKSASIFLGVFKEEKEDTEKLVDFIVDNAKALYEKRHEKK